MGTLPTDAINLAHALHEVQAIVLGPETLRAKIIALTVVLADEDLNRRLDRILPELRT